MNVEHYPPADGGRDVVPGDAHEGPHLAPLDAGQLQLRPLPLLDSFSKAVTRDHLDILLVLSDPGHCRSVMITWNLLTRSSDSTYCGWPCVTQDSEVLPP